MLRLRTSAYLVALTVSVTSCGPSTAGENTITQEEAANKLREHIDNTMAALPEGAELEERLGTNFAACDDPTDGGPRDRVTVTETSWIRGLPVEDNEANIALLHEYWTNNGYQVFNDLRPDDMFLSVRHEEDSFGLTIQVAGDGSLAISGSSPCVWPEGTPET